MCTFISDLDEQAETFGRLQVETTCDTLTEVLRACTGVDLERFIRVIGKINFVKYLSRLLLNGFDFHLMWRVLATAVPTARLHNPASVLR